jgi:hypothetical protein
MIHRDPRLPAGLYLSGQHNNEKGNIMRNILLFGTTAAVLVLGATGVYANGPLASPYEVLVPQSSQQALAPPEGRASYVGDPGCYPARVRIHGAWHNVQVCD